MSGAKDLNYTKYLRHERNGIVTEMHFIRTFSVLRSKRQPHQLAAAIDLSLSSKLINS